MVCIGMLICCWENLSTIKHDLLMGEFVKRYYLYSCSHYVHISYVITCRPGWPALLLMLLYCQNCIKLQTWARLNLTATANFFLSDSYATTFTVVPVVAFMKCIPMLKSLLLAPSKGKREIIIMTKHEL